MSILDEIVASRQQSSTPQEPQAPEPAAEVVPTETVETQPEVVQETTTQTQETTQPAQEQTTTNHTTTEPVQETKVSQFANEEVARMNAYFSKYPDKTVDDYKALTTPTDKISEEDLMRSYLSEKEGKTKSQIDYIMKQMELKEVDPDFDGEFENEDSDLENLKKKGEREALVKQAREWRDDFVKSELSFDNENQPAEQRPQEQAFSIEQFIEDAKKQQQAYTENYRTKIYEALPTLDKIDLEINGKTVSFVPDEEFKTEMRKGAEDVSQIGKEYFDEQANIIDPKGFITNNTLWANPKTRSKLISFIIDQAVQQDRALNDKARRNITLDDARGRSTAESSDRASVVDKLFERNKSSF